MRIVRFVIGALAALWIIEMLRRGVPLAWDEIEFFRATRWVALGRVPFRDFWEHHAPLQWIVFAPVARGFGGGAGTAAVLAMRWAQLPLWILIFFFANRIATRAGVEPWGRWAAIASLFTCPWLVYMAVQYRVDVLGNCAYFAALWLVLTRASTSARFAAGGLMACAVLANMRLAPLVIATTLIAMFWSGERWTWNPRALWIAAGGAVTAAITVIALYASNTMPAFLEGIVWYNRASDALVPAEAHSFLQRLIFPFEQKDVSAAMYIAAALCGLVTSLRTKGILQLAGILSLVSLATIAVTSVQYQYHFQTPLLLLMPVAGAAFDRLQKALWRNVVVTVLAASVLINLAPALQPTYGSALTYQNEVMLAVDGVTRPDEQVWDGSGYALRREPAYRYWFLPAGVRLLEQAKQIETYDVEQMAMRPPGAIVLDLRAQFWLNGHPRLRAYAMRHYAPLYQHLWIPAMSARMGGAAEQRVWLVPRGGTYDVVASELLAKHPWFSRPDEYGSLFGTEYAIPLERMPPVDPRALAWSVNGVVVTPLGGMLTLRAGDRLELRTSFPRPVGVLVVPHGVSTMSRMPEVPIVF
jgi:hypothetical protein